MVIWARKTYRVIMGLIFPVVYYFSPNKILVISIISFFLLLIVILEVERRRHPGLWPYVIRRPYGKIFKKEPGRILGTTYFLAASLLSILIFEKGVAILALLFSVFGDAASAIVGVKYGRTRLFKEKSLEGSLAFFIICFLVALPLISSRKMMAGVEMPAKLLVILVGSLAASLIEVLPTRLDDNFTIPLFSEALMEIMKRVA